MLPTITVGVEHLINWIGSLRAAAKQTREWTEELETAFLEALLASRTDPAWQLDPAEKLPDA